MPKTITTKILNALIVKPHLTIERGFMLCAGIQLELGGGGCVVFGGTYHLGSVDSFDSAAKEPNLAAFHIGQIMKIAEVENWDDLEGKTIRVETEGLGGRVIAIGHIIKDEWYDVGETMQLFQDTSK